jgi:hypothetical protein
MKSCRGPGLIVAMTLAYLVGVFEVGVVVGASFQGQVLDFQQKTIYHFQPNPSWGVLPYTAWVGLWKLPDGTIQCDFNQGNGPQSGPWITNPVIQSTNGGQSWTGPTYVPTGYSRGMAVFPGDAPGSVTMVRPAEVDVFGPSSGLPHICQRRDQFFGVQRSTDGGVTWSQPVNLVSQNDYQLCWPTGIKPLSDGRLVCMAGLVAKNVPADQVPANIVKTMFISSDKGQHWGEPITLVPLSAAYCEESDFVELPNGNLLWVHRGQNSGQTRVQSISRKVGDTFVSESPTACPLPSGGFPCDLMTREGVILDLGIAGSHWSGDCGQTWHDLIVNGQELRTPYYPQAVQTDDGTIIVVGHVGSDNSYGTADQSIQMQSFRLIHAPEPSGVTLSLSAVAPFLAFYCARRIAATAHRPGN